MHEIQHKILDLTRDRNIGQYTLRQIGELIGENEVPQKIKHHLNQLEKKGLIRIDKSKGIIEKTSEKTIKGLLKNAKLFTIPILGSANAGPATLLAEKNIEGYLRISSTLLERQTIQNLFALKVSGPSMNRGEIEGKKIEDGDFIIIDTKDLNIKNGDIVLSVIDGASNIKKIYKDKKNKQIVLMSESTQNFSPIYIHENDNYVINGKVIKVVKKPGRS